MDFGPLIEQNKQTLGNDVFSAITGEITGYLKNSGVELKSEVVPVAKYDKKEEITNIAGLPITYQKLFLGAGVLVIGFFVIKKFAKKAR